MQYLRDKYKNEVGYEYPKDIDKVEFYVEWLERIIDRYCSNYLDVSNEDTNKV